MIKLLPETPTNVPDVNETNNNIPVTNSISKTPTNAPDLVGNMKFSDCLTCK